MNTFVFIMNIFNFKGIILIFLKIIFFKYIQNNMNLSAKHYTLQLFDILLFSIIIIKL